MRRASRQSGRISIVAIAGIVSVLLVATLIFFNGESPRTAAADFMSALAKGDVDALTALSVVHKKSPDEVRKEWADAIKYGRTYIFFWQITGVSEEKSDSATVSIDLTADPFNPASYAEHKELTMVKVNGAWKVDVPEITRDMFPYMPQ